MLSIGKNFLGGVMEYLLTKEEFEALEGEPRKVAEVYDEMLQQLCTYAADNIPVKGWHNIEDGVPEPWRCVITVAKEDDVEVSDVDWCCDGCPAPVKKVCPLIGKRWSK
jgi:hypothetical protein